MSIGPLSQFQVGEREDRSIIALMMTAINHMSLFCLLEKGGIDDDCAMICLIPFPGCLNELDSPLNGS